jgi:hypothetical protein
MRPLNEGRRAYVDWPQTHARARAIVLLAGRADRACVEPHNIRQAIWELRSQGIRLKEVGKGSQEKPEIKSLSSDPCRTRQKTC